MTKIDGLEIVMTKHIKSEIDKELKKRFEELKPDIAKRYEELLNMRNMETDQFNDGFNDARAGKLETDHPHYDLDTDNWRLGYAWGMFEPMKEKLARERQVSDALYLLLVDDPNTKLLADQILINIFGKCEPSPSDVSVTQDVSIDIKTGQSVENTNPDYYKDELYLDEDFRMLAKTYPADVSAIGVTTLIDYVEAVEAELVSRINELHYANTVCMEQKHKIARRDELIKRLVEDAKALAIMPYYTNDIRDLGVGGYCRYCHKSQESGHADFCEIVLHRALMQELEKEDTDADN